MAMSVTQAYQQLRAAGFGAQKAIVMTAIGISESGLRTEAVGDVGLEDSTWGPSVGFLQVRTVKAQTGTGGTRDINVLTGDPAAQARAGFEISNGGRNFAPWSTFTSGAYAANLARVGAAVTGGAPSLDAPAPAAGATGSDGQAANTSGPHGLLTPDDSGGGAGGGLHLPNPAKGLANLLGLDDAAASVAKLLVTGTALGAGVVLIVLGVYRGVQPAVQKVKTAAVQVGMAVATDGASLAAGAAKGAGAAAATGAAK